MIKSTHSYGRKSIFIVVGYLSLLVYVESFSSPPPPSSWSPFGNVDGDGDDDNNLNGHLPHFHVPGLLMSSAAVLTSSVSNSDADITASTIMVSSSSSSSSSSKSSATPDTDSADQITQKVQNRLQTTFEYWKRQVSSLLLSKDRDKRNKEKLSQEQEELAKLQAVRIKTITAPNSTLLPSALLQVAGQQANLIGNPLSTSRVQHVAKFLAQHYQRTGHPLCSVIGATLTLDGECKLQTDEPKLSNQPVEIAFAKEMVLDENGNTLSFRQYKNKMDEQLRRNRFSKVPPIKRSDLNTTHVQTNGKTRPAAIAKALQMKPGQVFQWDASRWRKVAQSGIWDKVLHVEPVRLKDGTVQLRVIAEEGHSRRIEYGLTKSLYTGAWEGELDFENRNLFGGGEVVSVAVKRGARDPEPSVQIKFQDDKFGNPHGYSFELFQDYIGPDSNQPNSNQNNDHEIISESEDNPLLTRRGLTFRFSSPFPQSLLERSALSASFERTSTRTGVQENLGSTTFSFGPMVKSWPSEARHSILTTLTTGARLLKSSLIERPYVAGTIIARQIVPLTNNNQNNNVELAFRHALTTSSSNLPRHEANAAGVSTRVRGFQSDNNGPISSSLMGTTEIRIPFNIDKLRIGSGSMIFFADWLLAQPHSEFAKPPESKPVFSTPPTFTEEEKEPLLPPPELASDSEVSTTSSSASSIPSFAVPPDQDLRGGAFSSFFSKSNLSKVTPPKALDVFRKGSVGIGLRKTIQGIPVKYDLSLTHDGKVGAFFGIGRDFDVL